MRSLACLLVAIGLLLGCSSPFPPSTLVERLRVLSIKAEPPETDLFGTVTLTALTVDPKGGGRPLQYTFAACLLQLDYMSEDIPCPVGPDDYLLPSQDNTAMLSIPDLYAWAQQNGKLPTGSADGGTADGGISEVGSLPLVMGMQVAAGSDSVRVLKRVTLRLLDNPDEFNQNPTLTGITLDGAELGGDPVQIKANTKVTLNPEVSADSEQTYHRPGEAQEQTEQLLFSWFSTAGKFSEERTVSGVDAGGHRLDSNDWTAPESTGNCSTCLPGGGLVTLWVIARDGRFGEDWLTRQIEVVP